MPDFKKFCEILVKTNGNPSVAEVLNCGYTMEHFIRLCDSNISTAKLVEKAKESLKKMEV